MEKWGSPVILREPLKGTITTLGRFRVSLARALGTEISDIMTRLDGLMCLGKRMGVFVAATERITSASAHIPISRLTTTSVSKGKAGLLALILAMCASRISTSRSRERDMRMILENKRLSINRYDAAFPMFPVAPTITRVRFSMLFLSQQSSKIRHDEATVVQFPVEIVKPGGGVRANPLSETMDVKPPRTTKEQPAAANLAMARCICSSTRRRLPSRTISSKMKASVNSI